jgi:hypothetical protein
VVSIFLLLDLYIGDKVAKSNFIGISLLESQLISTLPGLYGYGIVVTASKMMFGWHGHLSSRPCLL